MIFFGLLLVTVVRVARAQQIYPIEAIHFEKPHIDLNLDPEVEVSSVLKWGGLSAFADNENMNFVMEKSNAATKMFYGLSISKYDLIKTFFQDFSPQIYGDIKGLVNGDRRFIVSIFDGMLKLIGLDSFRLKLYVIDLRIKVQNEDEIFLCYEDSLLAIGVNHIPKALSDGRIALFSFKQNTTLWVRDIYTGGKNFSLQKLHINYDNELIHGIGTIDDSNIDSLSIDPLFMNLDSNHKQSSLIISFSFKAGIISWRSILGGYVGDERLLDSCYYRGRLYIAQNARTGRYDYSFNFNEIKFTTLNPEDGDTLQEIIFGSDTNMTDLIALRCGYHGAYLMMRSAGLFHPHYYSVKEYSLGDSSTTILSWIGQSGLLFDTAKITLKGSPYVLDIVAFELVYNLETVPKFIIISQTEQKTSVMVFKQDYNSQIFISSIGCPSGCELCGVENSEYCLKCYSGLFNYHGICMTSCESSFVKKLENNIEVCNRCHPTCGRCINKGEIYSRYGCDVCGYNFFSSLATSNSPLEDYNDEKPIQRFACFCRTPFFESNGVCQLRCLSGKNHLSVAQIRFQSRTASFICMRNCPENRIPIKLHKLDPTTFSEFDEFDYQNIDKQRVILPLDISKQCPLILYTAAFYATGPGIMIQVGSKMNKLPANFTMSLWLNNKQKIHPKDSIVIDAFGGAMKLNYQASRNKYIWTLGLANSRECILEYLAGACDNEIWCHLSLSCTQKIGEPFSCTLIGIRMASHFSSERATSVVTQSLKCLYAQPLKEFSQDILIGGKLVPDEANFNGFIKEIKFLKDAYSANYLKFLAFKQEYPYSNENEDLLMYLKLNESFVDNGREIVYMIADYSNNYKRFSFTQPSSSEYPKLIKGAEFIELCYYEEIKECSGTYDWNITRLIPSPRYLGLKINELSYFNIFPILRYSFLELLPFHVWSWKAGDFIGIFPNYCGQEENYGVKRFINENHAINIDENKSWGKLKPGYYQLCGFNSDFNKWIQLDHIRIFEPGSFENVNFAYLPAKGNYIVTSQSTEHYSNIGDLIILAQDCRIFNRENRTVPSGYLNFTKIVDYKFTLNITNTEITKSRGRCRLCLVPSFTSLDNNKRIVSAIPGAYITIQAPLQFDDLMITPFSEGVVKAQANIFKLEFSNPNYLFDPLDKFFLFECSEDNEYTSNSSCLKMPEDENSILSTYKRFYIGKNSSFGFNPLEGIHKYCLCWFPSQDRLNNEEFVEYVGKAITLSDGKAVKFTIDLDNTLTKYPQVVGFFPVDETVGILKTESPTVSISGDIYASSPLHSSSSISVIEYLFSEGCFDSSNTFCALLDSYSTVFSERISTNGFVSANPIVSLTKVAVPILSTVVGVSLKVLETLASSFYGLIIEKNALTDGHSYFLTDLQNTGSLILNFTIADFTVDQNSIRLASGSKSFVITGTGFSSADYEVLDTSLTRRKLRLETLEVFLEMYLLESSYGLCDLYSVFQLSEYNRIRSRATVINDTHLQISNMNLDPLCNFGVIYGNFTFERVLYDSAAQIKYRRTSKRNDLRLGRLGCKEECHECKTDSVDCMSCPIDGASMLQQGSCVKSCSTDYPLKMYSIYFSRIMATNTSQLECVKTCSSGYFQDTNGFCYKCDPICIECSGFLSSECLICSGGKYLKAGSCVDECPVGFSISEDKFDCKYVGDEKLDVKIIDRSYKNILSEELILYFGASVFYNGTTHISSTWTISRVFEGRVLEIDRETQNLIFKGDSATLQTYITELNINQFISFFQNGVILEIKVSAGNQDATDSMLIQTKRVPQFMQLITKVPPTYGGGKFELDYQLSTQGYEPDILIQCIYEPKINGEAFILHRREDPEVLTLFTTEVYVPFIESRYLDSDQIITCLAYSSNGIVGRRERKMQFNSPKATIQEQKEYFFYNASFMSEIRTLQQLSEFLNLADTFVHLLIPNKITSNLCISNFDCFGGGICVEGVQNSKVCDCYDDRFGKNCQFNAIEFDLMSRLFNDSYNLLEKNMANFVPDTVALVDILGLLSRLTNLQMFISLEIINEIADFLQKLIPDAFLADNMIKQIDISVIKYTLKIGSNLFDATLKLAKENELIPNQLTGQDYNSWRVARDINKENIVELGIKVADSVEGFIDKLLKSLLFKEQVLDIEIGSIRLEIVARKKEKILGVPVITKNSEYYFPTDMLAKYSDSIKDGSLVTLRTIEWQENPRRLVVFFEQVILTKTKEIALFSSNGTRLDISNLEHPFDFTLNLHSDSKIMIPDVWVDCGSWSLNMTTSYEINYNRSIKLDLIPMTTVEKLEAFNFTRKFEVSKDFVSISDKTKKQIWSRGFDSSSCVRKPNEDRFICSCTHMSTFAGFLNQVSSGGFATTFHPHRDPIDQKTKSDFNNSIGFDVYIYVLITYVILLLIFLCQLRDIFKRKELIFNYLKFLLMWRRKRFEFMVELNKLAKMYEVLKINNIDLNIETANSKLALAFKNAQIEEQNNLLEVYAYDEHIVHNVIEKDGEMPVFVPDNSEYIDASSRRGDSRVNQFTFYSSYLRHNRKKKKELLRKKREEERQNRANKVHPMEESVASIKGPLIPSISGLDLGERFGKEIVGFRKGRTKEVSTSKNQKKRVKEKDQIKTKVEGLSEGVLGKPKKKNNITIIGDDGQEVILYQDEKEEVIEDPATVQMKKNLFDALEEFEKKFNRSKLDDSLPDEVVEFLAKVVPKELMSREEISLLTNWRYGIECLYEIFEFSSRYVQKDKGQLLNYLQKKRLVLLSNPISNLFYYNDTFICPPIIRLNYLFTSIMTHMLVNLVAFKYLSDPFFGRDDVGFTFYDRNENLYKSLIAFVTCCVANIFSSFFFFEADDILRIPYTVDDLREFFLLIRKRSVFHYLLSFTFLIGVSFMCFSSLDEFVRLMGRIYVYNWIWSFIFTSIGDIIFFDLLLSYLTIHTRKYRFIHSLFDLIKRYRTPSYDGWLTVDFELPKDRDFMKISRLFTTEKEAAEKPSN